MRNENDTYGSMYIIETVKQVDFCRLMSILYTDTAPAESKIQLSL